MTNAKSFENVLVNYDHELRLRYRQPTGTWCIERKAVNTAHASLDGLREVFANKANREIYSGMNAAETENQYFRRLEAKARLEALNDPDGPSRILIFMPSIDTATCEQALGALKARDGWARGRMELGDGARAAATRITREEAYQEEFEEARSRARIQRDMRDAGGEAWERKGYLEGSRISMAGV